MENIRSLFNAKSDMFLRKTVALNIILLWKRKQVFTKVTAATYHGSYYSVLDTITDINFFLKLLLKINIFDIQSSKRADRIKFKDFYLGRSIAINN